MESMMNRKISYLTPCLKLCLIFCFSYLFGYYGNAAFTYLSDKTIPVSSEINWGLSFQEEGKPPLIDVSADELEENNAYYSDQTDKKILYLTFDAGYENGNTETILDTLKKHNVPAAFFLVGHYLNSAPELVQRMSSDGHIVGNHTFTHPDMSKLSTVEAFKNELEQVEILYKKITGQTMPKYYRPPQGKYSETNLQMAKDLGYTTFFWSLAYVDWYEDQQPTREEALKTILSRIHPGAVILLHSTSSTNAQILDELISQLKNMGYSFKPLDQLIKQSS